MSYLNDEQLKDVKSFAKKAVRRAAKTRPHTIVVSRHTTHLMVMVYYSRNATWDKAKAAGEFAPLRRQVKNQLKQNFPYLAEIEVRVGFSTKEVVESRGGWVNH